MDANLRLAERLAEAIAAGSYRPGEWLKQVDLAESFSATRFETRRALEELTLRGVVAHVPQKGYRVNEPSDADISQVREVRIVLESEAARMVAGKIDDEGIALLERLAADFWRAVEEGTPVDRNRTNHHFHDTMYTFAGNLVLSQMIREVRDRARGTPMYFWPSVNSLYQSAKDHDEIVQALRTRNPERVADKVRQHILNRQ